MKNIWIIIMAIAVLVLFGFVSAQVSQKGFDQNNAITGNVVAVNGISDGFQEVILSFENYEYKLTPSTLVAGVPVKMNVDLQSVFGCMRDVRIPAFGVSKYVTKGDDIIEFTPTKSGTFNIVCSMNMGRGTFTVIDQNGAVADYTEPALNTQAQNCQAEGGCGCGGY